MDKQEIEKDIELRIIELENRIDNGRDIITQCRKQLFNLKKKLKAYKQLKQTVISSSAADGDL